MATTRVAGSPPAGWGALRTCAGKVVAVDGALAQLISLSSHGSAWLAQGGVADPPALERENSTFRYVGSVGFELRDPPGYQSRAETVTDWLRQLRDRGVTRLWLAIPAVLEVTEHRVMIDTHQLAGFGATTLTADEYQLAGFLNAGWRFIAATGGQQPELWYAAWGEGDPDAPGHRIWSVRYQGSRTELTPPGADLPAARAQLAAALEAALGFAGQQNLDNWHARFGRALELTGEIPYFPDMLAPAASAEARELAAMAAGSWVFGGMGSWNDLTFGTPAEQAEYQQISRNLYAATLQGFLASTNSDLQAEPAAG